MWATRRWGQLRKRAGRCRLVRGRIRRGGRVVGRRGRRRCRVRGGKVRRGGQVGHA